MKKVFELIKIRVLIYLLICTYTLFLFSCRNNENVLPTNSITLEYNGKMIAFDDIKFQEYYLDLDAGKGLRAYGVTSVLDQNNYFYYVIIDLKKDASNKYSLHKINFGTRKQLAKDVFRLELYYADLTDGFNKTNFQTSILSDASELKGTFSGRLASLNAPEINISSGKYSFYLNTVKSY